MPGGLRGRGVNNRRIKRRLALVLAVTVLLSGCSGVLFESKGKRGTSESLRLDSGEGWESYDKTPGYPYDKKKQ